jgi:hypothetical protein
MGKNNHPSIKILQLDCDHSLLALAREILQWRSNIFEIDLASSFADAHKALQEKE